MLLKTLQVHHFRNLMETELQWCSGFNVIWGNNAQGKTNLLEAIYLLGHLKSFRNARGGDFIEHTADNAYVGGQVEKGRVTHRIELALGKKGRTPSLNGKPVKKLSEFLGYLRPILFTPEEMGLIKGYPVGRRALLDRAIVQQEPGYLDRFQEFTRILKQRNNLLKKEATVQELEPWTQALAKKGSRIQRDRLKFLQEFMPHLQQAYQQFAEDDEQPEIRYPVSLQEQRSMADQLYEKLARLAAREKQLRQTLAGPHRDDPVFMVAGKDLKVFGSQGQQRSFLLAFKAAQVTSLEEQLGEPPVLLLDDLSSELDQQRERGFFNFLLTRRGQVFLTTTRPQILGDRQPSDVRSFEVSQGSIKTE